MSLVDTTAWRRPTKARSLAHLDRKRNRAQRERVGSIRSGPASGCDQPFGEISQRGLIEERGHREE
jgi:hypothetical protein